MLFLNKVSLTPSASYNQYSELMVGYMIFIRVVALIRIKEMLETFSSDYKKLTNVNLIKMSHLFLLTISIFICITEAFMKYRLSIRGGKLKPDHHTAIVTFNDTLSQQLCFNHCPRVYDCEVITFDHEKLVCSIFGNVELKNDLDNNERVLV